MTESDRPADTEGTEAPAQTSTQTVAEDEVATTDVPVIVQNPLFQTAPVDTSGIGGLPDLTTHPLFAQSRADNLQRAVDELEGNAPKSGNVMVDPNLDADGKDALVADLKVEQERAQAIADGKAIDADGNVVDDEEVAPEEQGEQDGEPSAQSQDAGGGSVPDNEASAEEGTNKPV